MKIAIVCDVLGEPNNGTTLAAYNLIGYLRERGHDVTVLCADPTKEGMEGFVVFPTKNLGPLNLLLRANNVSLAKGSKEDVARYIEGCDVVHVLIPFWLGISAMKVAKELGVPVTASFHAQAENVTAHLACMNSKLANHITYMEFYRRLYRYVDIVHYPTDFIRGVFEREIKTSLPCRVISNGVNDIFYAPMENKRRSDKFTIVCTGRFSNEKAQHVLIKAIGASPFRDGVKLLFAGSGPKEKRLRRLARRKKVDAEFHFYAREDMPEFLHAGDLYVHTAIIEIEAIGCLEAIACGLVPVICKAPRSATSKFALDERCLFKQGDKKDLMRKIAWFYEDRSRIGEYREKYRAFKERFRQGDCMREMEKMLEDAAKGGAK